MNKGLFISGKVWQVQEVLNRLEDKYYGWKLVDVIKDMEERVENE